MDYIYFIEKFLNKKSKKKFLSLQRGDIENVLSNNDKGMSDGSSNYIFHNSFLSNTIEATLSILHLTPTGPQLLPL